MDSHHRSPTQGWRGGMAKLESRLEQRPMGASEQPPPATGGGRLELHGGDKETKVPSQHPKEQAEGAGEAPIPGDFIRRYLAPRGQTGNKSEDQALKTSWQLWLGETDSEG